MFLTLRAARRTADRQYCVSHLTWRQFDAQCRPGGTKKVLTRPIPSWGPRAKSNHNPREKLCPPLLVVHLSAVDVVHVSFQVQEGCRLGACWNQRFPHATERQVLTAPWRLRSPGARGRLPPAVTDRFLTLLSI